MSDTELHQKLHKNLHRRDEALRHSQVTSNGSGLYWIVGSGIVLCLILALYLFGDAPPVSDDGTVAPSSLPIEPAAPAATE